MTEWFEQWFGEEYLRLYPHRDAQDAAEAVRLIASVAPLAEREVFDLACGPGRHAQLMRQAGARVTGLDLSMPLLRRAIRVTTPPLAVVRGDMRVLPFRDGAFDVVVNLFTSFGYFATDEQHDAVLCDVARVLRPGGTFVIDFLNADHVRAELVPKEERLVTNQRVAIERHLADNERFVVKEMHLVDDGRRFLERVRLYSPSELETMLDSAGLAVCERFGDYNGAPLTVQSPRAFLVAKRR